MYYLRGQAAEVLACAERAEVHWKEGKVGALEQAFAIRLRGLALRMEKNYAGAIAAHREALTIRRNLTPESEDVTISLNDLAMSEHDSGDLSAAERDYLEALQIAKTLGYRIGVATYTGNLAELALDREDLSAAEQLAREALDLAEAIGRLENVGDDCRLLALTLARQNRHAEGLPFARRAIEISTRLRMPDDLELALAALRECENAS
jgi:tetratricopeptide (TPR) repeat protein